MYVNMERFKTKEELLYFIDKYKLHKDDILYAFNVSNENHYVLIWC